VEILRAMRTVVVVGASEDPAKAAHRIPRRLIEGGYRVVPVNPRRGSILGVDAYADLGEVREALGANHRLDVVDVFRPARDCPDVVSAAVAVGARAVWLQSGIVSPTARALAEEAGLGYVENRCLAVDVALLARIDGGAR
jgi:uncharacterized protein